VATTKRTARPARKKYVPSAKQRAEDERIKDRLDHLTTADLKEFDRVLGKAINPPSRSKS
jgi:hypothetical protein